MPVPQIVVASQATDLPPLSPGEVRAIFECVPDPWTLNSLRADPDDGMEECVRRQRKLVRRLRLIVPLLERVKQLLTEERTRIDPLMVSRIHAIDVALKRVESARLDITSGKHEKLFEDTVKRYVVAHAARVEEEDLLRGAAKRQHILPTIGVGYSLLDSDCSRETRPPVTVEERLGRMQRTGGSRSTRSCGGAGGAGGAGGGAAAGACSQAGPSSTEVEGEAAVREAQQRAQGVHSTSLSEAAAACWNQEETEAGNAVMSACEATSRSTSGTHQAMQSRTHIFSNNVNDLVSGSSRMTVTGTELSTGVVSEMLVTLGARRAPVDVILPDHCPLCRVTMVKGIGEQVLVCPTCHLTKTFLDSTAASMAFGEDSVEFNMFQYRRINHFNDALNELQGKEKATITEAQLTKIMEEMYSVFGEVNKDDITYAMVRHIVRDQLRMVKCYKHIVLITSLLSGKPALQMSPRHETLARLIFELMQEPFERAPFKERHNFLSYPVTLFKICQMLGLVEFFPMLPLLRGEDKLKQQEELFQWICEYRGWQPPPSVLSNPDAWN